MMYFLAYTMQMSTVPETEVEALAEDVAEIEQARSDRDLRAAGRRARGLIARQLAKRVLLDAGG